MVAGKRIYVLPGQGAFPIKELDDLLPDQKTQAAISLEWEALWHPELPTLEAALDHAASWA